MKTSLENSLSYTTLTLLVLAAFYGIYFAKVLAQKQRGIQTRQIGRRKEKSIHTVEVLMSIATLGFSVFAIVMLHLQILQEERYLVNTFGALYQEYCRHVSRYLGRK